MSLDPHERREWHAPLVDSPRGRTSWLSWRVVASAVGVVVICGLAGASLGPVLLGPHYTAEARLIVGRQDLSAQSVPGYQTAISGLAESYARLGRSDNVVAVVEDEGGLDVSPIPESPVIIVTVEGDDATEAAADAESAADALIAEVGSQVSAESALSDFEARYHEAFAEASAATGGSPADAAVRQLRLRALEQAYIAEVTRSSPSSAEVRLFSSGRVVNDGHAQGRQFGGVVGLLLGVGLGASVLLAAKSAARRGGDG